MSNEKFYILNKYYTILNEAKKHSLQIGYDKYTIEQGLKEKDCFEPVIDPQELEEAQELLSKYMGKLGQIISKLEENEGQK